MLLKEIFYVLSTAVIVFVIMELFRPGIVLAYINFNFILLFWVISGIIIVLKQKKDNEA